MPASFAPFTSVAVFGGLAVDRIAVTAVAPTLGASNPGRAHTTPGGVGFNVAVTLARRGLRVRLAGAVGDDSDGRKMLAAAKDAGIDTGNIIVDPCLPTASYQAVLDDRGDLVVGVADTGLYEALAPVALGDGARSARGDEFWVIDANFSPATLGFLLRAAEIAGRPVAALPISPAKAVRFAGLDRRPTILFANRREAAAMLDYPTDDATPETARLAAQLGRNGFADVLVTDSRAPLSVFSAGLTRYFIPPDATVASVTGAGDALAAGTIYGLSLGTSLFAAVPLGLAAAALTVESEESVRSDLSPALLARHTVEDVAS